MKQIESRFVSIANVLLVTALIAELVIVYVSCRDPLAKEYVIPDLPNMDSGLQKQEGCDDCDFYKGSLSDCLSTMDMLVEELGECIDELKDMSDADKNDVLMIGVARKSFYSPESTFEMKDSALVLRHSDGWPDDWPITNDSGYVLSSAFDRSFPAVVIVDVPSMVVYTNAPGSLYA